MQRIDLTDAEHADLDRYRTFNAFFTRALRAGARRSPAVRDTVVSPTDGTFTQFGALDAATLLQAKGRSYSLVALLGEHGERVDALRGGATARCISRRTTIIACTPRSTRSSSARATFRAAASA